MDQAVVMADLERVHWGQKDQFLGKKGLPAGAQRLYIQRLIFLRRGFICFAGSDGPSPSSIAWSHLGTHFTIFTALQWELVID